MIREVFRWVLGDEFDDALFQRLCEAVARLGGTMRDREWVIGGSREVTTFDIELPDGQLVAMVETDIGLSLRGPEALVVRVAHETRL